MNLFSKLTPLRQKQILGFAGAMPAVIISVFCWQNPQYNFASATFPSDDLAARLAFAISWMIIPAVALLVGVFGASRRGFYGDAIEGTRSPQNNSLEINLRYNQNTIEQAIAAVIVWAGLAIELPFEKLVIVPNLAVLFAVGRATFWLGYLVNPMARTFGMTLTVFPTLIGVFWLITNN